MKQLITLAICALILSTVNLNAFWYEGPVTCQLGQPGPVVCGCFWCDEGGKKVPGSDMCDESDNQQGGTCKTVLDCHNTSNTPGTPPTQFPYLNLGPVVNTSLW
ncbi:MAG: hypothetical protein HQ472_03930 [Ignavibacteria bacterium]|nr:hypothetical protein [Ignavibacteria bacterium]